MQLPGLRHLSLSLSCLKPKLQISRCFLLLNWLFYPRDCWNELNYCTSPAASECQHFPSLNHFPFHDISSRERIRSSTEGKKFIQKINKRWGIEWEAWARFLSIIFSVHSTQSYYTLLFWSIMTKKRLPRILILFPRNRMMKHKIDAFFSLENICFRFCRELPRKIRCYK